MNATEGLCGVCKRVLAATVRLEDPGPVVLHKRCPEHGEQAVPIAASSRWYLRILDEATPLEPPLTPAKEVQHGCPLDCGPCRTHEQRLQLPIVPITSACNLDCPICYTHNKNAGAYHMPEAELEAILGHLRRSAPEKRIINLTGGEPTQHPDFERLVERCAAEGIQRITISTHGMRFLKDEPLLERLARLEARIILSFDSFKEPINRAMLGGDFAQPKLRVLELLEKHGLDTTLLPVLAKGLNDDEVGAFVRLALEKDFIRSLELHTVTFTGQGGATFARRSRYLPDEVLADVERQTDGLLTVDDFVPAPVAHPLCYQVTYVLRGGPRGWIPFPRFMARGDLRRLLQGTLYLLPTQAAEAQLQDVIARIWAEEIPLADRPATLATLRHLVDEIFDPRIDELTRRRRAEKHTKAIYLHSHMDEESFDTARIKQCCVGIVYPDGNNVPSCAYNVLYRERDPHFAPGGAAPLSALAAR